MTSGDNALFHPSNLPRGIRVAVTTRALPGVSIAGFASLNLATHVGDRLSAVESNRTRLVQIASLPAAPRFLRQVHGTTVVRITGEEADELQADAMWTDCPSLPLAILTADCLPIVLMAGRAPAVAVVHAGWRGLAAGVIDRTLGEMPVAGSLEAWIGPAISGDHYEVGEEVRDLLLAYDRGATGAFVPSRPGHWQCDLRAVARRRLLSVGVRMAGGDSPCTYLDRRFYSHRRDGVTGRFATLAWIAP